MASPKSQCPGRRGNQSPRTDTGVSDRRNTALCCLTSGLPQSALSLCASAEHLGHCGQQANSKRQNIRSLPLVFQRVCVLSTQENLFSDSLYWIPLDCGAVLVQWCSNGAQGTACEVERASLLLSRETTAIAAPVLSSVSALLLLKKCCSSASQINTDVGERGLWNFRRVKPEEFLRIKEFLSDNSKTV